MDGIGVWRKVSIMGGGGGGGVIHQEIIYRNHVDKSAIKL